MDEMLQKLHDPDVEVRLKTVAELREQPLSVSCRLFLAALQDESWRVRKAATEALVELCHPEGITDDLLRIISIEENASARNAAIESLMKFGKKVTLPLIAAFDAQDRDVKKFIIDILGEMKDRRSLPLLVKALKEEDENIRASAIEHLGGMGDSSVVDDLIGILKSGDLWTAFPAAIALGRIGDRKAIPALLDTLGVKLMREPALKGLAHLSAPETLGNVVPYLLDPSKGIQEEALRTVAAFYTNGVPATVISETIAEKCGLPIIEHFLTLARSRTQDVRTTAILLMGIMKDERAIPPLLELHAEKGLQEEVKRALLFIGTEKPDAIVPFLKTDDIHKRRFLLEIAVAIAAPRYASLFNDLITDTDGHVRSLAATGLSKISGREAVPGIEKLLADPYEDVQEAAVEALCNLQVFLDVPHFIGLLKHKNRAFRRNAALLLGKIGAVESVEALGFAMKDEDVAIRQAVVRAFSYFRTREAVEHLITLLSDEDTQIRSSAAVSLGSLGDKSAVEALTLLLNDTESAVRVAAVRALGLIADDAAVPHLVPLLHDTNGFVVTSVIESLAKLGGNDARAAVTEMLGTDDQEIRRTALRALASFDNVQGVIIPFLKSSDWATRIAAVTALSRSMTGTVMKEIEKLLDTEEDPAVRKTIEECMHAELGKSHPSERRRI